MLHPTPSATPAPSKKRNIDVRNHGFFIAGLIHAVAPESQLRLVRVLENDNRGDLFTLIKAIFNFLKEIQTGSHRPGNQPEPGRAPAAGGGKVWFAR